MLGGIADFEKAAFDSFKGINQYLGAVIYTYMFPGIKMPCRRALQGFQHQTPGK